MVYLGHNNIIEGGREFRQEIVLGKTFGLRLRIQNTHILFQCSLVGVQVLLPIPGCTPRETPVDSSGGWVKATQMEDLDRNIVLNLAMPFSDHCGPCGVNQHVVGASLCLLVLVCVYIFNNLTPRCETKKNVKIKIINFVVQINGY